MQRKHNQPRPSSQAIDRAVEQFNQIAIEHGLDMARVQAVTELTAVVIWLNQTYGSRASYRFIQTIADELVTPLLPQVA